MARIAIILGACFLVAGLAYNAGASADTEVDETPRKVISPIGEPVAFSGTLKTDEAMIADFQKNKKGFNQLVELVAHEKEELGSIMSPDSTKYREPLQAVGASYLHFDRRDGGLKIDVPIWEMSGAFDKCGQKGFTYRKVAPRLLKSWLNAFARDEGGKVSFQRIPTHSYRALDSGLNLYYDFGK